MDIDFGKVDEFFTKLAKENLFPNQKLQIFHLLQSISQLRKVIFTASRHFQPRPTICNYHCKGLGAIALMYMQIQRFFNA